MTSGIDSQNLTPGSCSLLLLYLSFCKFYVHFGKAFSSLKHGVPQESIFKLSSTYCTLWIFAKDIIIIAQNKCYGITTSKLQLAMTVLTWKIRLNESESVRVDFSLFHWGKRVHSHDHRRKICTKILLGWYVKLHLASKFNWYQHIRK